MNDQQPSFESYAIGLAIEQVAEAVVITDTKGSIQYVNSAFTAMTGYSPLEALGQNPNFLKSGRQDSAYYKDLWSTIRKGQTWQGELINRRKDGTTYTEEMTVTPVRGSSGEIIRYVAVKRDVTERRAAEERQRFLGAILASSDDAIIGKTVDGTIRSWNNAAELLLEYRADEIIGRPISVLMSSEPFAGKPGVLETIAGCESCRFETTLLTKSGRSIGVLITGFPIKHGERRVVGSAIIARDIRDQREAQAALRESEGKYRAIFEASRDALLIADAKTGMLVDANRAALTLLGRSLEEIPKLHQKDVHAKDDIEEGKKAFHRYRYEAGATEHVVLRSDGQRVPVEIAASPMRDASGRELILGIFHDLTAHRKAQEEVRESEERFRIMADGCPTIIWVTDAEGAIRFVNRTCCEFYGLTSEAASRK